MNLEYEVGTVWPVEIEYTSGFSIRDAKTAHVRIAEHLSPDDVSLKTKGGYGVEYLDSDGNVLQRDAHLAEKVEDCTLNTGEVIPGYVQNGRWKLTVTGDEQ